MPLRKRIAAEDSYGILFVLIIFSLTATAAVGSSAVGRALVVVLQGGVLLYALWTSRSGRRALRSAAILVPVVAVVAAILSGGKSDLAAGIGPSTIAAFTLTAIVAIARRVAAYPRVDRVTILAALSVYLLIGTFFAAVFNAVAAFSSTQFFTTGSGRLVDYLYFSFVTLTTTGYGDMAARTDLGRMLAVTEALLGQLYLVSVVAVVVGNLGRDRRS